MLVEVIYGDHDIAILSLKNGGNPIRGYAYRTNLNRVAVGDIVEVPPTSKNVRRPQKATVVRIGSDYTGETKLITRVVRRR